MKTYANKENALLLLDKSEDMEKVFDVDWDEVGKLMLADAKKAAAQMQAHLSVAEFKPEIKQWFESNLGPYGSNQYTVTWRCTAHNDRWSVSVRCYLTFAMPKYAALFRLTFL